MSRVVWDALIYLSGASAGFLLCWYWMVKPMARILGWDDEA